MVSGQDPQSMQSSQANVAEAMRRGQRLFAIRLGATWVSVLIITTVLVWIGIVVRGYIQARTPSLQSMRFLGLLFGSLVGIEAVLLGAMALATIRSQRSRRKHGQAHEHLWTVVVHRLQRWFALLLSSVWVTVLAVIAVVVIASAVGRRYVDWPADPWEATSSAQELWLLAATVLLAVLLLLAALLAQSGFRRLRTEAQRAEDIRVEPHTRPVEVTVEPHRDDTLTFTVRLEPHRDPGIQTLRVMTP
jgi:hypothetical protein